MKKPRIAFVTDSAHLVLPPDDPHVFPFLEGKADIEIAVWDDETVDWTRYDLAIVRAPWDYPLKLEAFKKWLIRMQKEGVRLQNSAATILQNLDKNYLLDLEQRGVQIVETHWLRSGDAANFDSIFEQKGWKKGVVKPAVSNGALNTWVIDSSNFSESRTRAEQLLASGDELLVQPFLLEILEEGEWSMLFFNGIYSHSILKRPKTGDFRVQYTHGGSMHPAEPTSKMIETGRDLLKNLDQTPLYARVDGIRRGDDFLLIELELIEPVLFIAQNAAAPVRWAAAILERVA